MRTDYRPEIDGLRAIAVGSVILSHMGRPFADLVPGGFVGVDIFFVISGFLITSILYRDMQDNRFSFADFYQRRARRILPALIVVCLASAPAGWFLMSPIQLQDFSQSLVSIGLFASNIFFWRTSGYFGTAAEEQPMIHTWSLAVEEQFYLVFPLVLLVLYRRGVTAPGMALIFCAALVAAESLGRSAPSAVFFLPFARVWELLLGAMAGYGFSRFGAPLGANGPAIWRHLGRYRHMIAPLAAVGLGIALLTYHEDMIIPGAAFLLPVGATAALLVCAHDDGIIRRFLAARPMVWVGLVSYSAYLWHQPVFAFLRLSDLDSPSPLQMSGAALLVLALAAVTWALVEQPFRRKSMSASVTTLSLGGGLLAIVCLGALGHFSKGFADQRFDARTLTALDDAVASSIGRACHGLPASKACVHNAGQDRLVTVLGDSHAVELAAGLADHLKGEGVAIRHLSRSACGPALTFETSIKGCSDWLREAVEGLEAQAPHTVVLVYRHAAHLYGRNDRHSAPYPFLPDSAARILFDGDDAEKRDAYWRAFDALVRRLLATGHKVVLVQPIPEIVRPVEAYILRRNWVEDAGGGSVPAVPLSYYNARPGEVRRQLLRIADTHEGVVVSDPLDIFCDAQQCHAVRDGTPLYFDDHHLSVKGAALVAAHVARSVVPFSP